MNCAFVANNAVEPKQFANFLANFLFANLFINNFICNFKIFNLRVYSSWKYGNKNKTVKQILYLHKYYGDTNAIAKQIQ